MTATIASPDNFAAPSLRPDSGCLLLLETPAEQRESMLTCLRITLDNAHTLYTRSDYDDRAETGARLRFIASVALSLAACEEAWASAATPAE